VNRRTLLQSAAVFGAVSLAGCIEGVQEHFQGEFQGIVPIEIHSESDEQHHNVVIEAYDRETNQQLYDEGITVTPGETVGPAHLSRTDQRLQVATLDDDDEIIDFQEVSVTDTTQLVLIWLYDDEFVLEVDRGEDDQFVDNETVEDPENRTDDPENRTDDDHIEQGESIDADEIEDIEEFEESEPA